MTDIADLSRVTLRRIAVEDVAALAPPTEFVAIVTEAVRKAYSPASAEGIYRAIGAAAEEDTP